MEAEMEDVDAQVDLGRERCIESLELLERGRVLEAFLVTMELVIPGSARQECA